MKVMEKVDTRLAFDQEIRCNGLPVYVTANAFALLEQISKLLPESRLWMDCVKTPLLREQCSCPTPNLSRSALIREISESALSRSCS
jgi:hypothetical protein